ncbi:L-seryl-tRNA(Sec) kinase-like isoform X2 [Ptychodera flava]|uniref:L-seryl-tRNA(Sec) kinase-like isoform X2 n=1 Tax=Ptychodera flava TaxID=63121 RepID=UPI00396A1738
MSVTANCHQSVIILCGLPGVGKTEFVSNLEFPPDLSPITLYHVCYDDFIPNNLNFDDINDESELQVNGLTWKQLRGILVQSVDKILARNQQEGAHVTTGVEETDSAHKISCEFENRLYEKAKKKGQREGNYGDTESDGFTFFVIDDNMFYRSMRYEYYQLARKYAIGFCEIHLHCPLDVARERNRGRLEPIPDETLIAMETKFEVPDATKYPWETKSISIDTAEVTDGRTMETVWNLVRKALNDPVKPLNEENAEEKEKSKKAIAASIIYQADQVLRKCVAESMKQAKISLSSGTFKSPSLC